MATRDQKQAQKVYEQISSIQKETWHKEYGGLCMSFPALVHGCGLCQAVAFVQSKSGDSGRKLAFRNFLDHLAQAVSGTNASAFTKTIREASLTEYQKLTRDVMSFANWYKRYAEAILKVVPGEDNGGA